MRERGHNSQLQFSQNFSLPFESSASDPMIICEQWEVPKSQFNVAPHGVVGAATRYSPTELEFEAARDALIGRLATRMYVEDTPHIDPAAIAMAKGLE